jgi:acyl dehydratase
MPVAPPQVGDTLPEFTRSTGLDNWNRYAAVNDEFVPIHMDDAAGQAAGYPTAFGMGNLQWSYLHNLLRDWAGDRGRIDAVTCQFRAPNLKGQTVTAKGVVTGVRPAEAGWDVDLEVWTEDQSGNRLTPGTAVVHFAASPDRSEDHQ